MSAEALAELALPAGIRPGANRLPCPRCASAKPRARDTALSVLVEADGGAVWHCHRCGWSGCTRSGESARPRLIAPTTVETPDPERIRRLWRVALPASAAHPYLVRKRLPPFGLRQVDRFAFSPRGVLKAALLVPLRDASGGIVNLQGIAPDGEKRFPKGSRKSGCFALVMVSAGTPWRASDEPVERLAIGEGWASVAAYCLLHPTCKGVAAIDAGNLPTVARLFRNRFPSAALVIAADNDATGLAAAREAAHSAGASIHAPDRAKDWSDAYAA